jgi:hypothetical protein
VLCYIARSRLAWRLVNVTHLREVATALEKLWLFRFMEQEAMAATHRWNKDFFINGKTAEENKAAESTFDKCCVCGKKSTVRRGDKGYCTDHAKLATVKKY